MMDYQYGEQYFNAPSSKKIKCERPSANPTMPKRLRLQGTRKIGCLAKITIKQYTLYPEYAISEKKCSSKRELKRTMHDTLTALERKLGSHPNDIKRIYRYFVSLPTEEAHHGHPTGEQAGFSQRVHPAIIARIRELVSAGVTSVVEVKRSLRLHVKETISKQLGATPKQTDRSLYPTDTDISNHIHLAKRALAFSKLDQENLKQHLEHWQGDSKERALFFRPYTSSDNSEQISVTHKPTCSASFVGNDGELQESDSNPPFEVSQTLLLVLQEDWQKKILERYGNTISLIDATYKTTQYELPLFFICVRTNVGYMVVAEFVIQSEESDKIQEAIEVIKRWNPKWNPKFFMCDYSEAELLALEASFPSVKVFLCDFHREQAWERWAKNSKHGLSGEESETLLSLLRDCAGAPPCDDGQHPEDYHYQLAVDRLQRSAVWQHETVEQWLTTKWLNIPQVN